LYFRASDGTGSQLWKYDGTNLSEIKVGSYASPSPNNLTAVGNTLYFTASTSTGTQVWKYDGSNLSEIQVGTSATPNPSNLTAVGNSLYFSAYDGTGGQLWKYDGSNLSEIKVGTYTSPSPSALAAVGNTLYFMASDGTGDQLWKYDGTTVSEVKVGTYSNPAPQDLTAVGGNLYFRAFDGTGVQLWRYDGSNLSEITVGSSSSPYPTNLTAVGTTLYFGANDGSGVQLWKYDGSNLSEIKVTSTPASNGPNSLTAVGSNLYFIDSDNTGTQLWKYDGSNLSEIKVGTYANPNPYGLTVLGSFLYFGASNGTGSLLWSVDTTSGTVQQVNLQTPLASSWSTGFTQWGNKVYFSASDGLAGDELWVTDGTTNGTTRLGDLNPGSASSFPYDLTVMGNNLYFGASDGTGNQLWKYDGSNFSEIKVGASANPHPFDLTVLGSNLYFGTSDSTGYHLWKYDGSSLSDIMDITSNHANLYGLMTWGGNLYFGAWDGTGQQLWKYDGSNLSEIKVGTSGNPSPQGMTVMGSNMYLTANDGSGYQLWKYDGSNLSEIKVGTNVDPNPNDLTVVGNTLYFNAFDGSGNQLWKYDGTNLSEIKVGTYVGPVPTDLTTVGSNLYFVAYDGTANQLWKYDGINLSEIKVGAFANPSPGYLTAAGSSLYFSASDSTGPQLWEYDGSNLTEITINPNGSSNPSSLYAAGNILFLSANDGIHGNEPWIVGRSVAAYNFAQGSGTVLTDVSGNGNNGTISNATWTTVNNSSLPFTGALQFAGGNNSYVTIANSASLDLTTGMTLEAWVDPTAAANGWQDVMYKAHDNYYLESSSPSGAPAAGGTAGSSDTGPYAKNPLPTNTWSFLAATYDGTNMILYVNGVQVSNVPMSGNLATSTFPLQIGGDSFYGQYFQGLISNVRIYSTALTANEIQEDMNTPIAAGTPPTTPANLTTTASGPTISLTWGASSDIIGVSYIVEREAPGSNNFVQIATTTGTSYFDNGLAPNSAYTYKVQAVDWAGNQSAFSNTASATTGAAIPGLMAAYNFAQGSGTVLTDLSGNGNNGTISNAAWTTVNNSNLPFTGALQFSGGNSSFVTIADTPSLELTTGMTLEAWVDPTAAANGWQDAMYKARDNYYLETASPSGAPVAGGTAGSMDTGPSAKNPLPTNTWTFLTATYDGTSMILYVNGMPMASVTVSGNLATSTNPLQIGGDSFYGQYFQGLISNVRIYSTALTAAEIQEDMTTPIAAGTPPPTTPANLTATASGTSITLKWGASSDGAGVSYVVDREAPGSSSFVQIATTTGTSYFDNGLAPNSAYTYKVQAVDWAGNQSAFSNTASATTGAGIAGLMAAYNFAQGSGSVLTDFSGNGNNGAISNATWTTVNNGSLPFTGALQFAGGNSSFVTITDTPSLELTTGMTLEAWVDPMAAANGWQDVMYKYHDDYYLESSSPSGTPAAGGTAGTSDTGPYGKTPLPVNTWTFLAATYDGSNMILYVNGVQVSSVAVSGNLATSTNPLQIGGDSIYGQYFQGLISNVRIYNKALSQSAIQTDMNTAI
jgi:ELWxxDGT repeat protein